MPMALLCCIAAIAVCMLAVSAMRVARRERLALRFGTPWVIPILAVSVLCSAFAAQHAATIFAAAALVLAMSALSVCAVTDVQTGYVFDAVTIGSFVCILVLSAMQGDASATLGGAAVTAAALGILYAVSLGRGLGLGDVKLGACIGAMLGATDGVAALGLAFVLGGAYAASVLLLRRAKRGTAVRFAPYLAAAAFSVALYRAMV